MNVKKRNLTELVMQIAALVLMFLPGMFTLEIWVETDYSITFHGAMRLLTEESMSLFDLLSSGNGSAHILLAILVLASAAAALVLFVLQFNARGEKSNSQPAALMAAAEGILFVILAAYTILNTEVTTTAEYRFGASPLFFVEAALLIALAVISLMGYSKAKKLGVIDEVPQAAPAYTSPVPPAQGPSAPDELMKYKQLLDAGAITPEEYEEKKRQLLNR